MTAVFGPGVCAGDPNGVCAADHRDTPVDAGFETHVSGGGIVRLSQGHPEAAVWITDKGFARRQVLAAFDIISSGGMAVVLAVFGLQNRNGRRISGRRLYAG